MVNPPATDPAKSPSVQPRDVTRSQTHAYADACAYTLDTTVTDDDLGSASDSALVLITGNGTTSTGPRLVAQPVPRQEVERLHPGASCSATSTSSARLSLVFDEHKDASTRAAATLVLNNPAKSPADVIFDQQALGAWLNFANGSVKLSTPVDSDGNGSLDSTFGATMLHAETVRVNPASTSAQIKAQKDVVERIATVSGS